MSIHESFPNFGDKLIRIQINSSIYQILSVVFEEQNGFVLQEITDIGGIFHTLEDAKKELLSILNAKCTKNNPPK